MLSQEEKIMLEVGHRVLTSFRPEEFQRLRWVMKRSRGPPEGKRRNSEFKFPLERTTMTERTINSSHTKMSIITNISSSKTLTPIDTQLLNDNYPVTRKEPQRILTFSVTSTLLFPTRRPPDRLALSAVFVDTGAPAHRGKYIVVFHEHATDNMREAFVSKWNMRKRSDEDEFQHHEAHTFRAVSGRFHESHIEELLKEEAVHYIEPNQERSLHAGDTCSKSRGPWGIERVNTHPTPQRYAGSYIWGNSTSGMGVDAYIIDSGVDVSHPDFGGRAVWGINTAGDRRDEDCEGHGTHVAGTVGSNTYGVAKKVSIIAVKCMGCDGRGDTQSILSAITWVAKQVQQRRRPSVANMSLGGSYSRAENDIVSRAIAAGVTYVIAAGNEFQDACATSPASTPEAITVGASDSRDQFADFSNYGTCVDIIAPGVQISSTTPKGRTAEQDGTSMACPHVAGVVAQILSQNPKFTPAQVTNALLGVSTPNAVRNVPRGTPNKLLFSGCNSTVVMSSTSGMTGHPVISSGFTSSGITGRSGRSGFLDNLKGSDRGGRGSIN
ncbi:peptidase S8/S53 subtilisin kexin sedolisin [Planoprotostelium fungivorum]|uniref:Peptidase S8/S53 subtilisin kexin sedolisin n=1 Tax=Planoprotostelium fungivorum TaxID=1890364 RepID=A0A2P6MUG3_9EUKA|nr:peptidase S8/S53 subtilisin kexin sedolisin [Planoprotostelium fungivorum]